MSSPCWSLILSRSVCGSWGLLSSMLCLWRRWAWAGLRGPTTASHAEATVGGCSWWLTCPLRVHCPHPLSHQVESGEILSLFLYLLAVTLL